MAISTIPIDPRHRRVAGKNGDRAPLEIGAHALFADIARV